MPRYFLIQRVQLSKFASVPSLIEDISTSPLQTVLPRCVLRVLRWKGMVARVLRMAN